MRYDDETSKEYHARPELSRGEIVRFRDCPEKYIYKKRHGEQIESEALSFGRLYHTAILEPAELENEFVFLTPEKEAELLEAAKERGSKARTFSRALVTFKEWKAEKEAEGREIADRSAIEKVREMQSRIYSDPDLAAYFEGDKKTEVTLTCSMADLGFKTDIWPGFRVRVDLLPSGETVLLDLKSTRTAEQDEFAREVSRFSYHLQAAFYLDVARANGIKATRFGFIAQEKEAPFVAALHWMPAPWEELGRVHYRETVEKMIAAHESGQFPGYCGGELWAPFGVQKEIEDRGIVTPDPF